VLLLIVYKSLNCTTFVIKRIKMPCCLCILIFSLPLNTFIMDITTLTACTRLFLYRAVSIFFLINCHENNSILLLCRRNGHIILIKYFNNARVALTGQVNPKESISMIRFLLTGVTNHRDQSESISNSSF